MYWFSRKTPILSAKVGKNRQDRQNFLASFWLLKGYETIQIKKRVGPRFGRFFHKLIWSPWAASKCRFLKREPSTKMSPAGRAAHHTQCV
jgi:hypothetical protein